MRRKRIIKDKVIKQKRKNYKKKKFNDISLIINS